MKNLILRMGSGSSIVGSISPPGGIPTGAGSVANTISTILNTVYSAAGIAAVAFMIVGGYKIIVSSGDPQNLKEGQDTLLWALAGLVIVVTTGLVINLIARLLGVGDLITVLSLPYL